MENEEVIAKLKTLTETEAKILHLKCSGYDYEEIGTKMNYAVSTVSLYAGLMYQKLGFDKEMHSSRRKKVLQEIYCPVIVKLFDEEQGWLPDDPDPNPSSKALIVVMEEYKEEQDKRIVLREKGVIATKPPQPPLPKPRRPWGLYALVIILLIALVYLITRTSVPAVPLPTQTPLPTYTLMPTLVPQIVVITTTPLPIPSLTPTLPITSTPTRTPIPTNTSTPTLTPRPTENILFEDNFNNGLSPAWTIESGEPLIVNGSLSALDQKSLKIYIGDSSWKNYSIQISISRFCDPIIGVRVKDKNNMVVLKSSRAARLQWVTVNNGVGKYIGEESLITGDSAIIDIIVDGNHFNWVGHVDLVLQGYNQGGVYLEFTCMAVDNFKVIKLP